MPFLLPKQGLASGPARLLLGDCGRAKEGLGLALRCRLGALGIHHWRGSLGLDWGRDIDGWGAGFEEAHLGHHSFGVIGVPLGLD